MIKKSLFLTNAKCRAKSKLFSELYVIHIHFPLENRGAASNVRTEILYYFFRRSPVATEMEGRVPALIFKFSIYGSGGKKYLMSTFKVLLEMHNWSDRSHILPVLLESVSWSSASVATSKFAEKSECIHLPSSQSQKQITDPVLLALSLWHPSLKLIFEKLLRVGKQHMLGSQFSLLRGKCSTEN